MTIDKTQIECPKCGTKIVVEDVISRKIEEEMNQKLKKKESELLKEFQDKESSLKEQETKLKEYKLQMEITIKERLEIERAQLKLELKS